jgi:sugar lactone lactonase YvrE
MEIRCIYDVPCILAECPLWHPTEQVLYWIDIVKPALHRLDPKTNHHQMWLMPTNICCIEPHAAGGLIAAMRSYFAHIELPSGHVTELAQVVRAEEPLMFNDGKCDRQGRYWAGTKDIHEKNPIASLYRFDHQGHVQAMAHDIIETNGIAWSPDNKLMYYCDTLRRDIWQCDFDFNAGTISNQRIFVQVPDGEGLPDGLTVDRDGFIWSAHWNGSRITRYTPQGLVDRVIRMPVPLTSCCCFGGADYRTLFVTSIRENLTEAELEKAPLSGCIFSVTFDGEDIQGLPETAYRSSFF